MKVLKDINIDNEPSNFIDGGSVSHKTIESIKLAKTRYNEKG